MPRRGGVLRAVDVHRLALEEDLALVERVDPGDALDQRRLAGAVVADQRHDLAARHVEVAPRQRLHGAEAASRRPSARGSVRRSRSRLLLRVTVDGGAPPRRRPGSPSCLADARLVHRSAYLPAQSLACFRNPSLIDVSLMLSLVTATAPAAPTGRPCCRRSTAVDQARRRLLALRQRDRELGGRVGLLLDGLVDRHALVAGEDVLDALGVASWPVTGICLSLRCLERRDRRSCRGRRWPRARRRSCCSSSAASARRSSAPSGCPSRARTGRRPS